MKYYSIQPEYYHNINIYYHYEVRKKIKNLLIKNYYKEIEIKNIIEKEKIYFKDMTGYIKTITATFEMTGDNSQQTAISMNKVSDEDHLFVTIIPSDHEYDSIKFEVRDENGKSITTEKYVMLNNDNTSVEYSFNYDENECNTFYFGVTEDISSNCLSDVSPNNSYWDILVNDVSLADATLYFDSFYFTQDIEPTIEIGYKDNLKTGKLSYDENINLYSYTFDNNTTTRDVITFSYNNKKYHFLWSGLFFNKVVIDKTNKVEAANVSDIYNIGLVVYFDATLSKLVYSEINGKEISMPHNSYNNDTIWFYAINKEGESVSGRMVKLAAKTDGTHTWEDVYCTTLPEGYTKIRFTSTKNFIYGADSTNMLTIPTKYEKPCFYADTSDDVAYQNDSVLREGYWDEVYTIRDAEEGKNKDIVDTETSNNGKGFKIIFKDKFVLDNSRKQIRVTYDATITEGALVESSIGVGDIQNDAYLVYDNNYLVEGDRTTTELKDKTHVYRAEIIINKVDEEDQPIQNAGFTIYGKSQNSWDRQTPVVSEQFTDVQGKITINNLPEGEYLIVETTVPEGYKKSSNIEFSIKANKDVSSQEYNGTYTFTGITDEPNTIKIVNYKGFTLPYTGGNGAIIFKVVGIFIVALAIIILAIYVKKNNSKE